MGSARRTNTSIKQVLPIRRAAKRHLLARDKGRVKDPRDLTETRYRDFSFIA